LFWPGELLSGIIHLEGEPLGNRFVTNDNASGEEMKLRKRWTKVVDTVAMHVLPMKYYNLLQCSQEGLWQNYFMDAEAEIKEQWDKTIWPLIKDFDFDSVLELAPGAGRNTERLCEVAKKIAAIDYNAYAMISVGNDLAHRIAVVI
jgi:hypothetical protein